MEITTRIKTAWRGLEGQRNAEAWAALNIQPLTRMSVEPEFRWVETMAGFDQLADPIVTLCTIPLPSSTAARDFMAAAKWDDFKGLTERPIDSCGAALPYAGRHEYRVRQLEIHQNDLGAGYIADRLMTKLHGLAGVGAFIGQIADMAESLTDRFGALSVFGLNISQGWMPPPHYLAPHDDFNGGIRFLWCPQAGTLVVPAQRLEARRRIEFYPRPDMAATPEALYPAFTKINGPVYQVPPETLMGWRLGTPDGTTPHGPTLPHAIPPHADGTLRFTALFGLPAL